jgi:hypothetical protein
MPAARGACGTLSSCPKPFSKGYTIARSTGPTVGWSRGVNGAILGGLRFCGFPERQEVGSVSGLIERHGESADCV